MKTTIDRETQAPVKEIWRAARSNCMHEACVRSEFEKYRNADDAALVIKPCNRWTCDYCGPRNHTRIEEVVRDAIPAHNLISQFRVACKWPKGQEDRGRGHEGLGGGFDALCDGIRSLCPDSKPLSFIWVGGIEGRYVYRDVLMNVAVHYEWLRRVWGQASWAIVAPSNTPRTQTN